MDACANTPATQPSAAVLLSTGSLFRLPLPRIAAIARAAGFEGLELVMGSPKIAPGPELAAAHALCPVRAVHAPFRNWSAWGGHKGAWRAAVDLAASLLGTGGPAMPVTLHPPAGTLQDAIQTRWFARAVDLPRLLDAPPGVRLALENLPWAAGGGFFGGDALAGLLAECGEKGLGLTLDVCHLGVSGRDALADLERVPVELIAHVHFSDAGAGPGGLAEHLPPGAGVLPLGPFLSRLGARGYAGTVSLELDPAHLPEDAAKPEEGQARETVRELERLRLGMARALCGDAPSEWAGSAQALRPHPGVAAFG